MMLFLKSAFSEKGERSSTRLLTLLKRPTDSVRRAEQTARTCASSGPDNGLKVFRRILQHPRSNPIPEHQSQQDSHPPNRFSKVTRHTR